MEIVKGFNEYTGESAKKRAEIKKILVETFEKYNFEPAETPLIEQESFVKGDNANDEAVSDIFKLKDKGKRNLALRYEFTFQLKRLMRARKIPFRRYQIGEVFRDEPVSSNRFRQFVQCDCDMVGSTIKEDAEVLALGKEVLDKLKIKSVIFVNNRKLLNEILKDVQEKDRGDVIREIDKLDKLSEKEVKANLKKYGAEKVLDIFKQDEKYFEKYDAYSEIKELKKYLKIYGVKIEFSPSLARGLSYYNGTIFEIKTKEMKETITAGGAYMFDKTQCVGISFGLARLAALAKIDIEKENYLVASLNQEKASIELARKLRSEGKNVSLFYGKPSKALDYADAYKISNVIFVGEKEVTSGKFKVKDINSGKEVTLKN